MAKPTKKISKVIRETKKGLAKNRLFLYIKKQIKNIER